MTIFLKYNILGSDILKYLFEHNNEEFWSSKELNNLLKDGFFKRILKIIINIKKSKPTI
jgi:hypothetical protein